MSTASVTKFDSQAEFNPKSILPKTKPAKGLSHLQNRLSENKQGAVAFDETQFGRIDSWTLDRNQTQISQSDQSSPPKKAPFIAFGVEAYPTRAVFDDICYDFVRTGRWCNNGRNCPRIHPIHKDQYLATVIRESIIYSRMRARRTGPASTPSGSTSKGEIDVPFPNKKIGTVCPTWHTDLEDEPQSDKESGYWSNSNDTADSSRDVPALSFSTALPLSNQIHCPLENHRHPRPKSNERCRKWLRGKCEKGYTCQYVHEDLEYNNDPDTSGKKTAIVVLRRGPETVIRVLHRHIRTTFGSGFHVTELSTGFESFCVIIDGLLDTSDSEILELLKPFGKVRELRRPIGCTSQMTIWVYFEKTSEAFAALVALHGKRILGRTLDVRPGNETNGNRLVFKRNAVQFEWDAPCRTVFMGYSTRRLAEQAIDDAQSKPCGEFMTSANIHVGIPAVGAVTVRFQHVPVDVDQDRMKTFGPHEGMVTGKPNFNHTTQDLIRAFKHMLRSRRSQITDVHIRHSPYRNGRMKASVTFANARDAQDAAASLHLSKDFIGGMSISAFHVKSISFALTLLKYQMVEPEIRAFQDRLFKDDKEYWINISVRKDFVSVQFSGDDVRVLAGLKAEFERILNGEQLYDNGKVVWDPYLAGPNGRAFLEKLQQEYLGVTIITSPMRCSMRLLGGTEKKALVRNKIINFINARRARAQYVLPLGHDVFTAFAKDERDGFTALEAQLGQGNVLLDSWQNHLVVSGDLDAYTVAKDAIFAFRLKHRFIGPDWKGETCPACTGLASSPIKLPCGHSWCRSCLRHYLKSAADRQSLFPLTCHGIGKRCGEPIPLFTARQILTPDDLEALFQSAFSAHVLTHPKEFHYCPTPDCPQIYRSTPEGLFMQCPECLSSVCTHCHTEAHEGLTCAEVREGDGLFWEWAGGNNVKQCPKCKMAIEKAEGCNHMMCRMCQTHICWVCMQTFENGLIIYGHMQSEHGGSGI